MEVHSSLPSQATGGLLILHLPSSLATLMTHAKAHLILLSTHQPTTLLEDANTDMMASSVLSAKQATNAILASSVRNVQLSGKIRFL